MSIPLPAAIYDNVPVNNIPRVMPTSSGLPMLSKSGLTDDGTNLSYKGVVIASGPQPTQPIVLPTPPDGSGPPVIYDSVSNPLPDPVVAGMGTRLFVSDAMISSFNIAYKGGGAQKLPVFSDGTIWRIG